MVVTSSASRWTITHHFPACQSSAVHSPDCSHRPPPRWVRAWAEVASSRASVPSEGAAGRCPWEGHWSERPLARHDRNKRQTAAAPAASTQTQNRNLFTFKWKLQRTPLWLSKWRWFVKAKPIYGTKKQKFSKFNDRKKALNSATPSIQSVW